MHNLVHGERILKIARFTKTSQIGKHHLLALLLSLHQSYLILIKPRYLDTYRMCIFIRIFTMRLVSILSMSLTCVLFVFSCLVLQQRKVLTGIRKEPINLSHTLTL